jgi:hypothetical protein
LLALGLVTLLALFYAEENWRGERAWANCQRELAATGVELDWQKFAPPTVPDEQNFASTPFLAPLFEFNRRPLQPGQSPWRDSAARDRAADFGAALSPSDRSGQPPPAELTGQMTDLKAALLSLQNNTNGASDSVPAAATRVAEAAAILEALEPMRPVLDELVTASHRPYSRFNIQYDAEDPVSILLPHYQVLQRVSKVVQVRASAELALDKSSLALEDLGLMLFLAESIRMEPVLVSFLTRVSLLTRAEQIVWEGLAGGRWSEPQLRELQKRLSRIDLMKGLDRCLQGERAAFGNQLFRYAMTHKNALRDWVASDTSAASLTYLLGGPEGWFRQEQVSYHRLFDSRVLAGFDVQTGRLHPRRIEEARKALELDLGGSALWRHNALSNLLLSHELDVFNKAALGQTRLELAVTACALERYRLVRGDLPQTLDALVPEFVNALPLDPCGEGPLKYRRDGARQEPRPTGRFLLYGVGWDESDDGGTTVMNADGSGTSRSTGDWVWPPYPRD